MHSLNTIILLCLISFSCLVQAAWHYSDAVDYQGERNAQNKPHGQGSLIFGDGSKVTGTFSNGFPHGIATQYFHNGAPCYIGEWYGYFDSTLSKILISEC